ncbi:MAG: co-chaperone DjlA [Pontibacterium sp.]
MSFDPESAGRNVVATLKRHRTSILIGAVIGLFSGGPVGLLMGGFIGYLLSRLLRKAVSAFQPQQAFFKATFSVMGKLAKADGRVTEDEIAFARTVMVQMRLDEARQQEAIAFFNQGKEADFDIAGVLKPLAVYFRHRANVRMIFVEIQLQAAFADGEVSPAELAVIQQVCAHLQMTEQEVAALVARMQAQQSFHHQGQYGFDPVQVLQDAYAVLGVEESATDAEVKKAYRKLMSQHHPDKLVAKGLPEEMLQVAKEKAQEIQAAYEQIRKIRKAAA